MLFELFVTFGLLWWILLIAACGIIIYNTEQNNAGVGVAALVAFLVLWTLLGDLKPIEFIHKYEWKILWVFIAYITLASVWMPAKWALFCIDIADQYEDLQNKYEDSTHKKEVIRQELYSVLGYYPNSIKLNPKDNKERILGWGVFFPFSMLWTVLDDFIVGIIKRIRNLLMTFMQNISNHIFRNVTDDLL